MRWAAHRIVLRLCSPMHVGAGKVGNLQHTRPYVTGRALWGSLTARLTRDDDPRGKPDPTKYQNVGDQVHEELAFTYFFPTTDQQGCEPLFPSLDARGNWGYGRRTSGAGRLHASTFRYRFLSTYASTALNYSTTSAEQASLHEVECLTPYTRDGEPVYLTGYVFEKENCDLKWQDALRRIQIGGERGYGWGQVKVVVVTDIMEKKVSLFGTGHIAHLDGPQIRICLREDRPTLAHTLAANFDQQHHAVPNDVVAGPVEPLVGRETTPDSRFGVCLSQARICYVPGARIKEAIQVHIGPFGVWRLCNASP